MAAENRGRAVRAIEEWPIWRMWVAAVLIFAVLAVSAGVLFRRSHPDTFWRAVAEAFVEIAFVVLLGAGLTHLLHRLARARAAGDATHTRRRDVIRRLAAADNEVAAAQRLLGAGRSDSSTTDQLRELTRVSSLFNEIKLDLEADGDLFPGALEHIRKIIEFLDKADLKDGPDLAWTNNFVHDKKAFDEGYRTPLDGAKAAMRDQVTRL